MFDPDDPRTVKYVVQWNDVLNRWTCRLTDATTAVHLGTVEGATPTDAFEQGTTVAEAVIAGVKRRRDEHEERERRRALHADFAGGVSAIADLGNG